MNPKTKEWWEKDFEHPMIKAAYAMTGTEATGSGATLVFADGIFRS